MLSQEELVFRKNITIFYIKIKTLDMKLFRQINIEIKAFVLSKRRLV